MGSSSDDSSHFDQGVATPQGRPLDQLYPAQKPPGFVSFLPGTPGAVAHGLTQQNFNDIDASQGNAALSASGNNPLVPGGPGAGQGAASAAGGAADASDLPPLMQEAPFSVQQAYRAAKQSGDPNAVGRIMVAYLHAGGGTMTPSRGGSIADIRPAWPGGSSHEGSHAGHSFGGGLY
jgi:hypothetical protein